MKKRVAKTLYEKRGGKFVPVGKDDLILPYGFGDYLVRVRKGSRSVHWCKKKLTVDYAKVEVAMAECADALASAIVRESEPKPVSRPWTEREKEAWKEYKRIAGTDSLTLSGKSAHDVAQKAVMVMHRNLLGLGERCPNGCAEVCATREER